MKTSAPYFQHPNRLLWLIGFSMFLLAISQVLWLKKVWNEQKEILKTETNAVFQTTMLQLQDSLVERSFKRDSLNHGVKRRLPWTLPSMDGRHHLPRFQPFTDTLIRVEPPVEKDIVMKSHLQKNEVRIMITTSDSSFGFFPKDVGSVLFRSNFDPNDAKGQKYQEMYLNLRLDTLSVVEIQQAFTTALQKAGLNLNYRLLRNSKDFRQIDYSDIYTKPFNIGILIKQTYTAQFYDFSWYLIQKTLLTGLFSIALLLLTGLAFSLIFNNLKKQKQLADQKSEFISNVTHELKTPITTVGVALEALDDFEVLSNPEKTKEYLHISKLELDRLKLMVDKILRLSMFDQETLTLRPEPFDLQAMVVQVVETMSLQARQYGVEMRFHPSVTQQFWVNGDRLHLSGVLFNLLDNALKYRSAQPKIDISLQHFDTYILLHVKDNGIGIEPDYQEQIFEKFFRVPTGNTHNVKGHGLGLSYVAQVIQKHGGGIRLESAVGVGSTFTLEIPASTPPPTA